MWLCVRLSEKKEWGASDVGGDEYELWMSNRNYIEGRGMVLMWEIC